MSKNLQRKKPGYTKNGELKIVSLSGPQLVKLLANTSKPKIKAKIQRRINDMGYMTPVVVDTPADAVV